ncbi:lysoplasmalogenase [Rhodanobacter sp. L36]|uniref:lysoplasmalogenase n=1 Tax=Rhodanobacter sp. L36 TaxID=1747221 RepID=UPI00131D87D8|nr:lysoplasmalogenase [Rhodanobacter sp. L36]
MSVELSQRSWRRRLTLAVIVVAIGAIAGELLATHDFGNGWWFLHWCFKPLATIWIFAMAWCAQPVVSVHYRRWILAGILFSCCGDVFLMLPVDLFVPGLLSFLLAHLCFLVAFLGDSRFAARPFVLLAALGYGALNLQLLWPSIPSPLRLPVTVYVTVLACMAGQAAVRARVFALHDDPRRRSATHAVIGALVFMLSDSLLAWNKFRGPIPLADAGVLATYYLAMWCIARSVQRDDRAIETT